MKYIMQFELSSVISSPRKQSLEAQQLPLSECKFQHVIPGLYVSGNQY